MQRYATMYSISFGCIQTFAGRADMHLHLLTQKSWLIYMNAELICHNDHDEGTHIQIWYSDSAEKLVAYTIPGSGSAARGLPKFHPPLQASTPVVPPNRSAAHTACMYQRPCAPANLSYVHSQNMQDMGQAICSLH